MAKIVQLTPDREYILVSKEIIQSLENPLSLAIFIYFESQQSEYLSEEYLADHFNVHFSQVYDALEELKNAGVIE